MTKNLFRLSNVAALTGLLLVVPVVNSQTTSPTIQKPAVQAPKVAGPSAPSSAAPVANIVSNAAARMVAPPFNPIAYKSAADSEVVVILVFSQAGDSVWEAQAPLLRTILKEPEFSKITSFEIDLKNAELATRFNVTSAGTILVMKGEFERIRSQRMVKADVIRKMLRLHTVL